MTIVLLVAALIVPAALGIALLAACPRRDEPGIVPWIAGAGFVVGVLVLTAIMRVASLAGVPFGLASIGLPAIALIAAFGYVAWRRRTASLSATSVAPWNALAGGARIAWVALVAWIGVRFAMLLVEVTQRPLYAWDAWSAWATKAKVYFAMHGIVPFADLAGWMGATTPTWYDAAPGQPATLPLLQAWIATATGAWDDVRAALPWWLFFVALVLIVHGEVRRRGASALHALVAAWLVATLPLANVQVALAGYADLPLAVAFALGTLAGVRALRTRAPVDVVAAVAALASLPLYKTAGAAWLVVALPGLAAAALGRAWHRRIAVVVLVAAIAVLGIAARFPSFKLGPLSFAYDPVWDAFAVDTLLLANWHLVALGIAGTLVLRFRRIVDEDMAPLTLILAAGAVWIAMLVAFPWTRAWGADYLGLNRAVLVLVPFAIAWMAVAMLDAPKVAEPEATPVPSPAPEPA